MHISKQKGQSGQAVFFFILGLTFFLLGAVGLGIDGAHLYAQYQMAQAAADAAAEAGIMSLYDSTNVSTAPHYFDPSTGVHTCGASAAGTPCYYAQTLNGFNSASTSDTVTYEPNPSGVSIASLSAVPVNLLRVTVSRNVPTTLMRLLGPTVTTVTASGTAAILDVPSAVPIIVTHPTNPGSLSFNGNPTITITGGPSKSVEVNSSDPGAVQTISCSNATVDLSLAGPNHNGADFGVWAPGGSTSPCFIFKPGTKPGQYVHASPIPDPLASVPVPSPTGLTSRAGPTTVAVGTNGCPSAIGCPLYQPGLYSSGISVKASNTNGVSLFAPGLYYISSGGFNMLSNSAAQMATGMSADPNFPEIGTAGMVVFNTGTNKADIFNFDANAGAASPITLVGAPDSSQWKGVLFYEDPTASGGTHLGTGPSPGHTIQGGGTINLTGTIYMSTRSGVDSTHFQNLSLQGKSGSTTNLIGEIIVNTLSLGGTPRINMTLDSQLLIVRQVALVQ